MSTSGPYPVHDLNSQGSFRERLAGFYSSLFFLSFFLVVHLDRGNGDPRDGAEPGSRMIYKRRAIALGLHGVV